MREAYRRDAEGNYVYAIVVWADVKKSAKSSIAAAVALERASDSHFGTLKIIGNDIKQADSRSAFYARRAVQLNPRLAEKVRLVQYKLIFDNYSIIEAIPIDPTGEAGGNDDLIIYTEAWGLKDKKDLQMYAEMAISPTKYGQSQIWVESYAGYEGESPILENLYESGVKNGHIIDLGIPGLEVYANEQSKQLTLWNTQPRLPWQTPEYYAMEAGRLTPSEFSRIHRNQWAKSLSKFVPDEWWEGCKRESPPLRFTNQPMVLALDAAEKDDNFGMVLVSADDDVICPRYIRKWGPGSGGVIEYGNPLDPEDTNYPEGELRRLHREYNIVEYTYDRYQLHDMATRLKRSEGMNFVIFAQGDDRLVADKRFYDLIKEKRFINTGDQDMTEHVQNANKKEENGRIRIVKRVQTAKIDLAVCGSMAADRAVRLGI